MKQKQLKWLVFILSLLFLLILASVFSFIIGEININLKDLPTYFSDKSSIEYNIISNLRIPRILLAFAVGGSLSLTGAILQGIYRNPLVEPYTLGISGGAALGIAIVIVFGLDQLLGSIIMPLAGFVGSLVTIFLVYILSQRKGGISINRMLLIGVMISFISSSLMMFLLSISTKENLHTIMTWTMGSLEEPNDFLQNTMLYASIAGLLIAYLFVRPLNALRLGQIKAMHLGVNSVLTIRILFVLASVLTGLCVSVVGIIGFVGLIIPQIIKLIIGPDYRILLVGSFLGGSLFLIICDMLARTIISPNELPIGVITGIVGGIIFIFVLGKLKTKIS